MSQPNIHHQPPPPQHSMSQPNVLAFMDQRQHNPMTNYARPVARAAAPQFLSMENFQMTPELLAEIEQAHRLGVAGGAYASGAASGTAGVAYAGGATSGAIAKSHFEAGSPPKDHPMMERLRVNERLSPRESDPGQRAVPATSHQRRDSAREKDREWDRDHDLQRRGSLKRDVAAPSSQVPPASPRGQSPLRSDSPTYHTPMGTPGENSTSYAQYEREPYPQPAPRPSSPLNMRKTSNASYMDPTRVPLPSSKGSGQTPPNPSAKARTPDKSLPVQEEAEEDVGQDDTQPHREGDRERWAPNGAEYARHEHEVRDIDRQRHVGSPTPSSDLHPEANISRYDHRHDRGREGHPGTEDMSHANGGGAADRGEGEASRSQDEESYTPRSPVANLPPERSYAASRASPSRQQTIRVKNRNGSTDQLGLRTFDATVFEHTVEKLKIPNAPTPDQPEQHHPYAQVPQGGQSHLRQPHLEDVDHFLDDPAGQYYQNYLHSPQSTHSRPGAPVPPTPHSQTAAPSPSPLISGMQRANGNKPILPPYSPAPPGGSPYPYPYGHIRRGQNYVGSQNGTMDLSQFDPNIVREQMALQMQIYALNNGGMVSDSTLSPSSTPFPGPSYNPWAYLQAGSVFGGGHRRHLDSTASMRSSPSHEPVHLPMPNIRSRGLRRRERSANLHVQGNGRQKIKPPPRVDSTQPRETSPEMSSGEETAGESKVDERFIAETNNWAAGEDSDEEDGDWVDEEVLEGDEDDLLQLEFHTDYVSNPEKRRRRFKTRWEALLRAFHALDRETDTTLVLLAAPLQGSKLHAVASRSLRREPAIMESAEMGSIRTGFAQVAAKRRAVRSQMSSLIERLSLASASSRDGSPSSSVSKEEELRRALETALGSLSALGNIYEQREGRWVEEMRRLDADREKVQLLLHQVLGVNFSDEQANHVAV
ncbi:hypothetical protein BV25DRAFT_1918591 [Artomyces pyxidatus]|uniref:Uncharacterized protein n=1 Tax=Artomyces pyxidatus TaxID=48021 RepID=A0ACB8STS0_9AGAM|nr:hypothetical protein BV25DRAFT_1918591 [Artomyces pyxidatus]